MINNPTAEIYHGVNKLTLTSEMVYALQLLETTKTNVLLMGKAGTGKSTFLQLFREKTRKNIIVVAPTGVSALNVQGQTIHSLFRFPPRFVHTHAVKTDKRALFRKLDLLIIDEISMVRADVLDGINHFLQKNRQSNKPFGGVQICMIGDVYQLPPVVSREEQEFFAQYYSSPFFFSTPAYNHAACEVIEFQTVHRQRDTTFINLLQSIREGACHIQDMTAINQRVSREETPEGALTLTTTNAIADGINARKLAQLPGDTIVYHGDFKGEITPQDARLPAPQSLALKVGAQVMFVKNDTQGQWVNGTLGKIERLSPEEIVVSTDKGAKIVTPEKWQTIGYEFSESQGCIIEKPLGSYTQMPLILAWAMTIHKSQGRTIDKITVDLGHGAFAPGQLYVALSRCRALENIQLKRAIKLSDMPCDTHVLNFMKAVRHNNKDYLPLIHEEIEHAQEHMLEVPYDD